MSIYASLVIVGYMFVCVNVYVCLCPCELCACVCVHVYGVTYYSACVCAYVNVYMYWRGLNKGLVSTGKVL